MGRQVNAAVAQDVEAGADNATVGAGRLVAVILVTAAAAIIYELLIGTQSVYLNGDSALQFSLTIGVFLAAMGAGAFFVRDPQGDITARLVRIEIAVALLGGVSGLLLYAVHATFAAGYLPAMVALVATLGILVGMELPLLAELLRRGGGVRGAFASALAVDYVGSLVGSLVFPLVLLPTLGVVKTALFTGGVNLLVVVLLLPGMPTAQRRRTLVAVGAAGSALLVAAVLAGRWVGWFEQRIYRDEILLAQTTRFQRIVVTRYRDDVRLYSDKELQFSSRDEYRYHEALIHPALAMVRHPERVLVIGGGDGLGVRELLKDRRVNAVTLVDIDPAMTDLGRTFAPVVALNRNALHDPRVEVVNADGFAFANRGNEPYDVIVLDLPDPRTEVLARLYSREFYARLLRRLNPEGVLVTQAGSPYYTRESYWSIVATLRALGLATHPYRINVPAFGEWGFVAASRKSHHWDALRLPLSRRYLTEPMLQQAARFDADTAPVATARPSTLEQPVVWRQYRQRVRYWRD